METTPEKPEASVPGASQELASTPAPPQPAPPPEEQEADPAALAAKYRTEQDAEARAEIVASLWEMGSPAAVEMLRSLFAGERDEEVKADILSGVADVEDKETHESCYGLLVSALAPGQPPEVRLLAAHLLTDFEDARVPGLLQQFTQDADADFREAAKDAIEALKEK
jgi:HEAT repeat protein